MFQIVIFSLLVLNALAAAQPEEPTEAKPAPKCCVGVAEIGWMCCSDGRWHADRGHGGSICADLNFEDSEPCEIPNLPAKSPVDGCRDPRIPYNDVSCDVCCDQNLKDCLEYSGEEWYNSIEYFYSQDCPDACPKCASCFTRDEENLKALVPPEGCNPIHCEDMDIGIDPCFARGSCECFCETANELMAKCPQVDPSWIQSPPILIPANDLPSTKPIDTSEAAEISAEIIVNDEVPSTSAPESIVGCSERDRIALMGMSPPAQCNPQDCATMDIGIDPCFGIGSCECFCDQANNLMQRCPDVEPSWGMQSSDAPKPTDTEKPKDTVKSTDKPIDISDIIATDTFTISGPFNLEDIEGEKDSLLQIYSRTLQVAPFTTVLSVSRVQGIVQIQFTTTAFPKALQRLHTDEFKIQLNANILSSNKDLARSLFIHETDVVGYFAMEGFWELSRVQKFQEDLRMIFASTLKVDPDSVEEEVSKEGKVVQVLYEVKGNPLQLAPLYNPALFSQNLNTHIAAVNPVLAHTLRLMVCPPQAPESGTSCQGNMKCMYGEECCCGSCFPSVTLTCDMGQWYSMFSEACMTPPCSPFGKPKLKAPFGGPGLEFPQIEPEFPQIEPEFPQIEPGFPQIQPEFPQVQPGFSQIQQEFPQIEPQYPQIASSPGLKKKAPQEQTVQKELNYTQIALVLTFSVILGIMSAVLVHCLCTKRKTAMSEQTDDLYHEISLDTDVLARSV